MSARNLAPWPVWLTLAIAGAWLAVFTLLTWPQQTRAAATILHLPLLTGGGFSSGLCFYGGQAFGFVVWLEQTTEPCAPHLDFPLEDLDSIPVFPALPAVQP